MKLQITTSLRDVQNFNECFLSSRFLNEKFNSINSTTIESKEIFDEDEQEEIDDLEDEVRYMFEYWGLEEFEFERVED